jgi:hypothetical protein
MRVLHENAGNSRQRSYWWQVHLLEDWVPPATNTCSVCWRALTMISRSIITVLLYRQIWEPWQLSRYSDEVRDRQMGFDYRQREKIFSTPQRPHRLWSTQPIQRIPGDLSSRAKRPGREADHSPPSSAEVKNGEAIPPLLETSLWLGS